MAVDTCMGMGRGVRGCVIMVHGGVQGCCSSEWLDRGMGGGGAEEEELAQSTPRARETGREEAAGAGGACGLCVCVRVCAERARADTKRTRCASGRQRQPLHANMPTHTTSASRLELAASPSLVSLSNCFRRISKPASISTDCAGTVPSAAAMAAAAG